MSEIRGIVRTGFGSHGPDERVFFVISVEDLKGHSAYGLEGCTAVIHTEEPLKGKPFGAVVDGELWIGEYTGETGTVEIARRDREQDERGAHDQGAG